MLQSGFNSQYFPVKLDKQRHVFGGRTHFPPFIGNQTRSKLEDVPVENLYDSHRRVSQWSEERT